MASKPGALRRLGNPFRCFSKTAEVPLSKEPYKPLVQSGFERPVGLWLLGTAGMVAGVIGYGGYTRLTESGLSMTDWSFHGRPLPCTDDDWDAEYAKYQNTLEYQRVHYGLTLDEFKRIYFNEWAHRMLARTTGLAFLSGSVYYTSKGVFRAPMFFRCAAFLGLFGCQGLLGWWMVKSGFEERTEQYKVPRVSPYRLAAHLSLAVVLYTSLLWTGLRLVLPASIVHATAASCAAAYRARSLACWVLPLAPITFISGVFVAGNDAGRAYNTWPKMLNAWVPEEVFQISKNLSHIWENTAVVQFNHRCLAYLTVATHLGPFNFAFLVLLMLLTLTSGWWLYTRALPLSRIPKVLSFTLANIAVAQAMLGIGTLLTHVPVSMGVTHQALGLCLLSAALVSAYTLKVPVVWPK